VNVRIRGITGTTAQSDLALDDIGFAPNTGIATVQAVPSLLVLPTGADGVFTLALERPAPAGSVIRVLDATGREVKRLRADGSDRPLIDLSGAAPGLYLLRLEGDGQVLQGRVVRP
jgi:hypothetical protein